MSQFSNTTYGSKFTNFAPTNTQQYGPQLASLLAGGLRATGPNGPTPTQGYYTTNPYNTSVDPSNQVTSAQAPASGFDPSQGAQLPAGGPGLSDLSTDPILQQIQAAGVQAVQDARSAAMRNAENALIGYGSTTVPESIRSAYAADQADPILAALTDSATAQAAQANPDSTLMRLQGQNVQNEAHLNQGDNAANLFYSSTRGNDLGNLANTYRSAQNDAAASLGGLLGGQEQNVLGAQAQAQANYLNALEGAWSRWMSMHPPGAGPPPPDGTSPSTPPPTAGGTPPGTAGAGGVIRSPFGILGSQGPQTIPNNPLAALLGRY